MAADLASDPPRGGGAWPAHDHPLVPEDSDALSDEPGGIEFCCERVSPRRSVFHQMQSKSSGSTTGNGTASLYSRILPPVIGCAIGLLGAFAFTFASNRASPGSAHVTTPVEATRPVHPVSSAPHGVRIPVSSPVAAPQQVAPDHVAAPEEAVATAAEPRPDEQDAFALESWHQRLEQHAREPIDRTWAGAAEASFSNDLASFGREAGFDVTKVECATNTCTARIAWTDFSAAQNAHGAILHYHFAKNCARSLAMEPADRPGDPYEMTVLFDCSEFRAAQQ